MSEIIHPPWAPDGSFYQDPDTGVLASKIDLSEFRGNYGYVTEMDDLKRLLYKLGTEGDPISFDIETGYVGMDHEKRSLDVANLDQMIVGFSLTNGIDWARYIPLRHDNADNQNMDPNQVWPLIKDLFESDATDVVCHSFQFEGRNLQMLDAKGDGPNILPTRIHDTQVQSYVIGQAPPFGKKWHTLKQLTRHWFNYDQRDLPDLVKSYAPLDKKGNPKFTKKDEDALRFNRLPLDFDVQQYVCDDVTWCLRLDQLQRPNIEANVFDWGNSRIYDMELQILDLLVEMAGFGISVDWSGIAAGRDTYNLFISNMEKAARGQLADLVDNDFATAFNFNSPPQVSNLLFTRLGLKPTAFTDTGRPSTSEDTLEGLRKRHPIIDTILKLRQVRKMGQWFEQWVGYRTTYDDKIHPSLNQTRVQSGRFASDNPNVQNITKKWWYSSAQRDWDTYPMTEPGEEAFEAYVEERFTPDLDYWTGNARDYLIASPGYRLLSFDYAQQELRVLAGLSKEPYLIESFAQDVDIHSATAALMFGVGKIEDVSKEQRQRGKTINFALIYGQGPKALGDALGISTDEAKALYATYFSAFTLVGQWITQVKMDGKRHGYVTSFLGRHSTLWDLFSDIEGIRAKADRMCVNIPVQGGGADISKMAMLRARQVLRRRGWWGDGVKMLMNQHDSLVFEVRDDLDLADVVTLLEPAVMLEGVPEVAEFPPLKVDWETGHRWGSVKKFKPEQAPQPAPIPITQTLTPEGSMIVRYTTSTLEIQLEDGDGFLQFGEDFGRMSVLQKFGKLSALAELLGSDYAFKHGQITQEEYRERLGRLMPVIKESEPAAA